MTDISATDPASRFDIIVRRFTAAMLVTRAMDGSLHARPMWIADIGDDGEVVLVTRGRSEKVAEIGADADATVTFQGPEQFASLSGTARVVDDRALVERLWRDEWQAWFSGGKDDPSLRLIVINGERGEYWDHSGEPGGRAYRFRSAPTAQPGSQPAPTTPAGGGEQQHGKVDLDPGRSAAP